MTKLVPFCK